MLLRLCLTVKVYVPSLYISTVLSFVFNVNVNPIAEAASLAILNISSILEYAYSSFDVYIAGGKLKIMFIPHVITDRLEIEYNREDKFTVNSINIGKIYTTDNNGQINTTLKAVAITRLVCKKVYIPSTTALASLDKDAQVMALKAGANTIMLINTPVTYRKKYKIYDNKNMVDMDSAIYAVTKAGRKMPKYLKINKG